MKYLKSYEVFFHAKALEEELQLAKADLQEAEDKVTAINKLYKTMEANCLYTFLDLLEDAKEEADKRYHNLEDEVKTIEEALEYAWKLYEATQSLEDIWKQGASPTSPQQQNFWR